MSATIQRSGLSRQEFAATVGCGTSQLFKYQKEGLPPRMNKLVRANILEMAMEMGVLPESVALRANISKLAKGELAKGARRERDKSGA